jgi:molybdopterin/thiamine biosynthesis adenylyltransferase
MTESRYNRQELVKGVGVEGQRRLREARVAVVGVGALGCAVCDQIVRGGVGYLRLIDPDIPEISNLQRQVLIDERDVERRTPKARAAAAKLTLANSEVDVEAHVDRLDEGNAASLLDGVDLVLDGTDNFAARYLINRTCRQAGTPWIFGGVLGSCGMSFPVLRDGPCLRCALGPEPPVHKTPTTEQMGVLCSIVATIASLEVVRALKLLCGHEVVPELALVDLWNESMRTIAVDRDPRCPVCAK